MMESLTSQSTLDRAALEIQSLYLWKSECDWVYAATRNPSAKRAAMRFQAMLSDLLPPRRRAPAP